MMEDVLQSLTADVLLNIAFLLSAFAFLLRDILWLRLVAIIANLCMLYNAALADNLNVMIWLVVLIVINLGQSIWLLYERHVQKFTQEEAELCDLAFPALEKVAVRRLLRCGEWRNYEAGRKLINQGEPLDELTLILSGQASVVLANQEVSQLPAGKFAGEIAFLAGCPACATVKAAEPLRCLVWKTRNLRKKIEKYPELKQVLQSAVGRDLAQKVVFQNQFRENLEEVGMPTPQPA